MAKLYNLARVSTATTGTGTVTLGAALSGYLTFALAGVADGDVVSYAINDGANSEIGTGTYTAVGTTLTRNVTKSTKANAAISLSGSAQVLITARAEDLGKWTNRRVPKTAAYTLTNAEAGATIALGGAAYYALTIPAASGLDSDFLAVAVNEDTARGKLLLPVYTTSATSLLIATGAKAFTVAAGLLFPISQRFRAFSLANNANFMAGSVSYSGTTLTITVDTISGSGTFADWQIAPEIILWPRQTVTIFNDNNTWVLDQRNQLWFPDATNTSGAITINVDPAGNDSNDGLSTTTGAVKTLGRAVVISQQNIYTRNNGIVIIDGGGNTIQEFVQLYYPQNGGNVVQFQNMTWKPANSSYCMQFGDYAQVIIQGITVSSAGVTTPAGFFTGHQYGVMDANSVTVTPTVAITNHVFDADCFTRFNINTITINAGTISGYVYHGTEKTSWNINGAHTFVGTPTIGRFARATMGASVVFQGNVTFTGTNTTSVSLVNQGGLMQNLSGATLPGGTPTPTTGGQYNTTTTA